MAQTLAFQTEIKQLLHLMINSLYSNKEIFLRELVSNASDAIDKLKFEQLQQPTLSDTTDFCIKISVDKDANMLIISDNGIGMNYDEVIDNIGTIAKSGTKAFMEKISGNGTKDANLIGQFGVGFYSAFIVAEKVKLITLKAGESSHKAVEWISDGTGEFTIDHTDKLDGAGTVITLYLKPDNSDLVSEWSIRSTIRKYSDHINYPIKMLKMPEYDKDGKEIVSTELETVNKANALWVRNKSEITTEEYQEFYKHITHDYSIPAKWVHARVEGAQEYIQLLYIPSKAQFDLYDAQRRYGIKLYINRVFVIDDAEKLLPNYLRFVRGIIDSQNLPLNVSRELLQSSKDIDGIRSGSTKKVLTLLEDMFHNDADNYAKFWTEFGSVLKEGIVEDATNKERIAKLCLFASSYQHNALKTVSVTAYIARMQPTQDKIYYITADSYAAASNSPHLEIFKKRNIEVLLLTDRVDEWVVGHLTEFETKHLVSVAKGNLDLTVDDTETAEEKQQHEEQARPIISKMKEALGDRVKDVVLTAKLVDSPACLVSENSAMSMQMERILRQAGQEVPNTAPVLEINIAHPLVSQLEHINEETRLADLSLIIFEQAQLADGVQLADPTGFIKRINSLIMKD